MGTVIGRKIQVSGPTKLSLTGNEAIVRGALEAGVRFVSGYPGTPASEIGDIFREISADCDIRFEDSVNEKVAIETAFTASILGFRSLASMKHLGLAYAGDPIGTIPYVGTTGGFVVVSGGDPGLIVSPNEQDQRYTARMLKMPVFDPASPQDACDMSRFAFSYSEQTRLPVLIRTTIQVNFSRGVVLTGELPKPAARTKRIPYTKSPQAHVPIPMNARRMRAELETRIEKAASLLSDSGFFPRFGDGKLGILTSGVSLNYVLDAVAELGCEDDVSVLHLGCVYPLPPGLLNEFLDTTQRILVVEELLPFAEETLKVTAQDAGFTGSIVGKASGHLPEAFALDPDIVREAVRLFIDSKAPSRDRGTAKPTAPAQEAPPADLAPRPPVLCSGCPHRATFLSVRLVLGEDSLACNDIGCYTLGYGEPLDSADMLLSMGSSIAMASAASRLGHKNSVAYIGDSTFFHSGLPALANAVRNADDIVVVVLDNQIVAMTGHQSSFSTANPGGEQEMSIEDAARGLGAKVWVVDPDELDIIVPTVTRIKDETGVRVLVTRKRCPLDAVRTGDLKKEKVYRIDRSLCRHCGHEAKSLYCAQPVPREYERKMAHSRVLAKATGNAPGSGAVESSISQSACAEMGTHDGAPCARSCPVNICVQGYIGRTAAGDYAGALEVVRKRNPLPVISSYVCHRPCERACVTGPSGSPVPVNRIKEFLITWENERRESTKNTRSGESAGAGKKTTPAKKVAIVGAGPAGLACADEVMQRGYGATVFDAHDKPGGMLELAIPPYRLPRDMLALEIEKILENGVEFVPGWKLGGDNTVDSLLEDGFDAVCVAVGAHKATGLERLTVGAGGDAGGAIRYGLDYIKDAIAARVTKTQGAVVVVGGGDCAIDAARTAIRLGADSVTILYRRSFGEMPARLEDIGEALAEGVRITCHGSPTEVCVEDGTLKKVIAQKTKPGEPDESGRRRPVPVPGAFFELDADGVLLSTGEAAGGEVDMGVSLQPDDSIVVDSDTGATSRAGVFAAGDVAGAPRTVLDAIASGRRAGYGIAAHLSDGEAEPLDFLSSGDAEGVAVYEGGDVESLLPEGTYRLVECQSPRGAFTVIEGSVPERPKDFSRPQEVLSEAQAREIASQCLLCGSCGECSACLDIFGCPAMHVEDGKVAIDEALCTGCGVCALFCPNGAIIEVPLDR
jgi:indolepyruvate ferredoxin oxidoreductase alpha subunit